MSRYKLNILCIRIYGVITVLVVAAMFGGLFLFSYSEVKKAKSQNLQNMQEIINSESVQIPNMTQELEIEGEQFLLLCEYGTGNYDLRNWKVTDSKVVTMKVKTKNLPEGYEVFIDHVHADISLKSEDNRINGITQDTMDDTYHGNSQDGFYINDNDEYYNIFAIEGYNETFYDSWGYVYGKIGNFVGITKRLTEDNIRSAKTYAEKMSIVYDISIKTPWNDKYYTKSVTNEFLIPLAKLRGGR